MTEAFAAGIHAALRERKLLTAASSVVALWHTAASGCVCHRCARCRARFRGGHRQADAGEGRARLIRRVTEAFSKRMAALGRPNLATPSLDAAEGSDRIYVASDGKADYVYLRSLAKGQPLARALDEALAETIAKAAYPEGDALSARRRHDRHVCASRASPDRASRKRDRAGDGTRDASRQYDGGPPILVAPGHRHRERRRVRASPLEAEGKVMPDFTKRRGKDRCRANPESCRSRLHALIMPLTSSSTK